MSRNAKKWAKNAPSRRAEEPTRYKSQRERANDRDVKEQQAAELDEKYGFSTYDSTVPRTAFLFNIRPSSLVQVGGSQVQLACLDCLFVGQDGSTFKASVAHAPYFYVLLRSHAYSDYLEVESYLMRRFEGKLVTCSQVALTDLDMPNHLSGLQQTYVKLTFHNVNELMDVRRVLMPIIVKNRLEHAKKASSSSFSMAADQSNVSSLDSHALRAKRKRDEVLDAMIDIREYDVPYVTRVCIDLDIRVGRWYTAVMLPSSDSAVLYQHSLTPCPELIAPPVIKKLAFDIETTKPPLKFPNSLYDRVTMISVMVETQGYLFVNREEVSEDIENFEYSPSEEMTGQFDCINCSSEKEMLESFFQLIRNEKPLILITYNGDFFDWPFIERRCIHHGLDMYQEIGVYLKEDEYTGQQATHLDCFAWVKRDSYLPQGSQGLKAVTKAKLKYNPVELDPEDMMRFAQERPQELAAYSVSDAVSTYYLYMKYIHMFVFSLATIIPMCPGDVLRKGSGTLCESLLQVEAHAGGIIAPNKQEEEWEKYYAGRLLESETYIGGHVECIESGVFRSDIPCKFNLSVARLQSLKETIEETIHFAITNELNKQPEDVVNLDEVIQSINQTIDSLIAKPNIEVNPSIIHLDVGAMYPNIILTNRLQPMAIVDESICASCDYNAVDAPCQRAMTWHWRGKYFPATKKEVSDVRTRIMLEYETKETAAAAAAASDQSTNRPSVNFSSNGKRSNNQSSNQSNHQKSYIPFNERPPGDQAADLKAGVKRYSHKVYSKYTVESTEERTDIVCQRENSFYVDTVRAFRDRRYEYKVKSKISKNAVEAATTAAEREVANNQLLVYDSLQLAHKCILNSFYGYVMRRGARWHSIEMAGIVTNTGAELIKEARKLVDDIGRPLELDTDGIWCMLPSTFPDTFTLKMSDGSKAKWSYPCSLLNIGVNRQYTNHQYMDLVVDPNNPNSKPQYTQRSECSIFFEVDGPYRAMILPAAREEGKNIKKRYAVFDHDGSLAELKGFEIKRRGELKLIKVFQAALFNQFLLGETLIDCYDAVAAVCNHWLDVLLSHGVDMEETDLIELISESKSMADSLEQYGDKRSTSISTAKRLAEFLGEEMVVDKGLNCQFVISSKPEGASVSDRAIPVAIFAAEESVKRTYLRKWLKDQTIDDFDIRSLVDWSYYVQRLSAAIQKIVTIPAAMQRVPNPVVRVKHPDWLGRRIRERDAAHQQMKIGSFFAAVDEEKENAMEDVEDMFAPKGPPKVAAVRRRKALTISLDDDDDDQSVEKRARVDQSISQSIDENAAILPLDDFMDDDQQDDVMEIESKEDDQPSNHSADLSVDQSLDPSIEPENFDDWLIQQRKQWQALRARRKERKRINQSIKQSSKSSSSSNNQSVNQSVNPALTDGLHNYFKHSSASLATSHWQIVQLIEEKPGIMRAWVFLSPSTLTSTTIRINRSIYLNSRTELNQTISQSMYQSSIRRVDRTLPRGHKVHHLYEYTIDEQSWRDQRDELTALIFDNQSINQSIEGIYEQQIPLLFKAIRDLGCLCKLDRKKYDSTSEVPIEALINQPVNQSINPYSINQGEYLTSSDIRKHFLYHSANQSVNQSNNRAIHLLVLATGQCTVLISGGGERPSNQSIKSIYQSAINEMLKVDESISQSIEQPLTFRIIEVDSISKANQSIKQILSEEKSTSSHPSVLLYQSNQSITQFYIDQPWIKTEYPVISIPFNNADNNYSSMDWVKQSINQSLMRYLASFDWFNRSINQSRYASIPIGNLDSDFSCQALDFMFARTVQSTNHLQWWSSADLYASCQSINQSIVSDRMFDVESRNPCIEQSGCYRSISVEIELAQLCVSAILESEEIEQECGGAMEDQSINQSNNQSEETYISNAPNIRRQFELLKHTVISIVRDSNDQSINQSVSQSSTRCARVCVLELYRWLHSPYSPLRDELLCRHVQSLMQKLHTSFLATLERFGSKIIHASFHHLILDTGKYDVRLARNYVEFLVKTISNRPLFAHLTCQVTKAWYSLIHINRSNYCGVVCQLNDETQNQSINDEVIDETDLRQDSPSVESHWCMTSFLPPRCVNVFSDVIGLFVLGPHLHRLTHRTEPVLTTNVAQSDDFDQQLEDCCTTTTRSLLRDEIAPHLFGFVSAVQSGVEWPSPHMALPSPVRDVFPILPGAYLPMKHVALEFTKQMMHVLSYDNGVRDEIRRIRESLYRIVGIAAFSPLTEFVDPSAGVMLPDLCCQFCGHCEDVDLGQQANDTVLIEEYHRMQEQLANGEELSERAAPLLDENGQSIIRPLQCTKCSACFDRCQLDDLLGRSIERNVSSGQMEDLVCCQCGTMKDRYLMDRCTCAGKWRCLSEGKQSPTLKWPVIRTLCAFFGLEYSYAMIEMMCQMEGIVVEVVEEQGDGEIEE